MKVRIRVQPGAARAKVGGAFDGALVVRVTPRAVDGKATAAALKAVADALGLRVREVTLVSGATSRLKTVEIPDGTAERYRALLGDDSGLR